MHRHALSDSGLLHLRDGKRAHAREHGASVRLVASAEAEAAVEVAAGADVGGGLGHVNGAQTLDDGQAVQRAVSVTG
jgi:hypothetical protein